MAFSKPLPGGQEFEITVRLTARFVDEKQAEGCADTLRDRTLTLFSDWEFMDGFCRNPGVSSYIRKAGEPSAAPFAIRLPPKTIEDAIREYKETRQTAPVTLLHKVLDKLIGLTCPHCHKEVSITIE